MVGSTDVMMAILSVEQRVAQWADLLVTSWDVGMAVLRAGMKAAWMVSTRASAKAVQWVEPLAALMVGVMVDTMVVTAAGK